MKVTRRGFIAGAVASVAAATLNKPAFAQNNGPIVCCFSKHLQFIEDYGKLAETAKGLGLDGLDVTVRAKGHVLPANASEDLPRCVEAIRGQGLDVPMITTRLSAANDPDAKRIFEPASKLGIKYARIGGLHYPRGGDILDILGVFTEQIGELAAMAADYGISLGYHNHSGDGYLAAPIWDLHKLVTDAGHDNLGANLDVGHVTVEGGAGAWRTNSRLIAPMVKMMAIKDFRWENGKVTWCSLGEGHVQLVEILKIVNAVGFAGPMSLHFEYKTKGHDALLDDIKAAAGTLRTALGEAGYA
jgi:sugar phosphate isomerase/epimerase